MCSQAASLQVCWLQARQSTAWFKVTVQFFLRGIFACLLCARASQVALPRLAGQIHRPYLCVSMWSQAEPQQEQGAQGDSLPELLGS